MTNTIISAGVDFYSGGMNTGSAGFAQAMELSISILLDLHKQGARIEPYKRLGYEGNYAAGAFYGEREDGSLWQWPGGIAHEAFLSLAPYAERASRVDVQVTFEQDPFNPNWAAEEYDRLQANVQGAKIGSVKGLELYTNNKGGQTIYVGSRQSDSYICIYQKGAQSGDSTYENCWRVECRYKNRYAAQIQERLKRQLGRLSQASYSVVLSHAERSGVDLALDPRPGVSIEPPRGAVKSDVLATLQWLEKSVRPAINRLRKLGIERDALLALGLVDLIDIDALRD